MITVALVDDHLVTRRGIKTVLELNKEINVVLEASNGLELIEKLGQCNEIPEMVILDINMPVMNGIATIDHLKANYPAIHILVFSLLYEEDTIINMISRGACGYVSKSADPVELSNAVTGISNQGFYLGELVKKQYFRKHQVSKKREGFYGKQFLTARELDFIRLASSNRNYAEIAELMEVRPKTLENYRDSVFHKLGINNRAALAVFAYRNGLF